MRLGVPVVLCSARSGEGLCELLEAVKRVMANPPENVYRIQYPKSVTESLQNSGRMPFGCSNKSDKNEDGEQETRRRRLRYRLRMRFQRAFLMPVVNFAAEL